MEASSCFVPSILPFCLSVFTPSHEFKYPLCGEDSLNPNPRFPTILIYFLPVHSWLDGKYFAVVWNEIKGLLYIVDDLGDLLSMASIHIYTITQGATTLLLFHLEIQITGSNLFDLLFSPYVQLLGVN